MERLDDLVNESKEEYTNIFEKFMREFNEVQTHTHNKYEVMIKEHNEKSKDIIKLNVGGELFTTTRATLTKEKDSMLAVMFSGKYTLSYTDGYVFIDRNPKHFSLILDYLRDDNFEIPLKNNRGMKEFRIEAEYYGLDLLIRKIDTNYMPPQENLVVHLRFDDVYDKDNQTVIDSSGNEVHGTIVSADGMRMSHRVNGPFNDTYALHLKKRTYIKFDNIKCHIPIHNEPYCIAFWVRKPTDKFAFIINWGERQPNMFTCVTCHPRTIGHIWWGESDDTQSCCNMRTKGIDKDWHHIVMQYNGIHRQIWLDCVMVAQNKIATPHNVQRFDNMIIGDPDNESSVNLFDLRLYDVSLSPSQIKTLYMMYR